MELGSEFNLSLSELSVKEDNIFTYLSKYSYVAYFDSGRSALRHLASIFSDKDEILLPEFICESVIVCFKNVRFYKLHKDFSVDIESLKKAFSKNTKAVFIMHYFGNVQNELEKIRTIADEHKSIIIEDTTHSIFSEKSTIGDYQICSIRKWLPIPKGGILYATRDVLSVFSNIVYPKSSDNNRTYGMILKDLFLNNQLDCNSEYRSIFSHCESMLDQQKEIYLMSDLSKYIASCFDVRKLRSRRIENYNRILESGIIPAVSLKDQECPLVFPIASHNRDKLRNYLMEHHIYCAVHWPFYGKQTRGREFALWCANHLISLPIDQRYENKDIEYLICAIKGFERE